jgi:hypothetical protein
VAESDKSVGQIVTWVGQPITSQGEGGGTQHVFFGKGPDGAFSFDSVFIAEESEPPGRSPGGRVLDEAFARYMEERHRQHEEENLRRNEEMKRRGEELRKEHEKRVEELRRTGKLEVRGVTKEDVRKHREENRKRAEEARKPENVEAAKARVRGKGASPAPVFVTVTGTIVRFDTLVLLGHGTRHDVPVLRGVKITADPQAAADRPRPAVPAAGAGRGPVTAPPASSAP